MTGRFPSRVGSIDFGSVGVIASSVGRGVASDARAGWNLYDTTNQAESSLYKGGFFKKD